MRREAMPRQIRGLQLLFLIRAFYRVDAEEHTSFELTALMETEYPGDDKMAEFKHRWDYIVRHLRTPLSQRDLENLLVYFVCGLDNEFFDA